MGDPDNKEPLDESLWHRLTRRFWQVVDRAGHVGAKRRALRRAALRGPPRRVLVVCYGNICRSPYVAAALRGRLAASTGLEVSVDSAGLFGPGRAAHSIAVAVGRMRGVELGGHASRLVTTKDATVHDLALVMTRAQRIALIQEHGFQAAQVELLADFGAAEAPTREIPDPYGKPAEVFEAVFDQIDRAVDTLVAIWAGKDR